MPIRSACHIHSEWSYDGSWTLDAIRSKFSDRGYRVVMMTEHDRGFDEDRFQRFREACARASSESVLVVPGIEYSDAENRIHVLVWGLCSFLGEGLATSRMLDAVKDLNGIAVLAHPDRLKAWEIFDPYWAERLLGIESWNRKYDGWAPGKNAPRLLREADQPIPFVGLDFHTKKQLFPLAMALELAGQVTEDSVLRCLRSKQCHAEAFGFRIKGGAFSTAEPALNLAEYARRTAAVTVRSARSLAKG